MVRDRFIEVLRGKGYSYTQAVKLYSLLISVLSEVFLEDKRLEFRGHFILKLSSNNSRFIRNPRNGLEYYSKCIYFSCKQGSRWRQSHDKGKGNTKTKRKRAIKKAS